MASHFDGLSQLPASIRQRSHAVNSVSGNWVKCRGYNVQCNLVKCGESSMGYSGVKCGESQYGKVRGE